MSIFIIVSLLAFAIVHKEEHTMRILESKERLLIDMEKLEDMYFQTEQAEKREHIAKMMAI